MNNKNKIIIIVLSVLAAVLAGAVVYLLLGGLSALNKTVDQKVNEKMISFKQGEEAAKQTQKLIDEAKKSAAEGVGGQVVKITRNDRGTTTVEEEAVVVAPGASPVSVETGEVVNMNGEAADNSATGGSMSAPSESYPIDPAKLPAGTVLLQITPTAIVPAEFKVKAGQAVFLAATAGNDSMEIFRFEDPVLSGVVVGLEDGQTRAIVFNAPTKAGEYVFYSDVKDHRHSGAVGKMIVEE